MIKHLAYEQFVTQQWKTTANFDTETEVLP